jgi:hypothetical protein
MSIAYDMEIPISSDVSNAKQLAIRHYNILRLEEFINKATQYQQQDQHHMPCVGAKCLTVRIGKKICFLTYRVITKDVSDYIIYWKESKSHTKIKLTPLRMSTNFFFFSFSSQS